MNPQLTTCDQVSMDLSDTSVESPENLKRLAGGSAGFCKSISNDVQPQETDTLIKENDKIASPVTTEDNQML